jgi:hypothetical protein
LLSIDLMLGLMAFSGLKPERARSLKNKLMSVAMEQFWNKVRMAPILAVPTIGRQCQSKNNPFFL